MSFTVQAPNGDNVEFPDDTPIPVAEAAMRAKYGGPAPAEPPSALGSVAEAGRRFVSGVGGALTAVPKFAERVADASAQSLGLPDFMTRGIVTGAPMPTRPEEGPLYKIGQEAQAALPAPNPQYDNSLVAKAGGVGGNIAGLLATYLATGPVGAAVVGGSSGGEAAAEQAQAKGATPEQQNKVAFANAPLDALLSTLPVGRIAGRLGSDAAESLIGGLAKSGVENAAAGGAGQVASNAIAQQVYDPNKPLMEDVPEAALVSGIAGPVVHGVAHGIKSLATPSAASEAPVPENALVETPPQLPAPAPENRPAFQEAAGPVTENERAAAFQAKAAKANETVQAERTADAGGYTEARDAKGKVLTDAEGRTLYTAPKAEAGQPKPAPAKVYGEAEKAPRTNEDLSASTNEIAARTGEDPVKLVENQLGIPPGQFHALPGDAKERVVAAAQRQRTAEVPAKQPLRTADEAGRAAETTATSTVDRPLNEGPSSPAAKPQPGVNAEQPDAMETSAGKFNPDTGKRDAQSAAARTSAGGSERPFVARDSAQPEHDALFEERAAKVTADAKARAEAEAKARYTPETPTSNTPKGFEPDGNYSVDQHGFVLSDKGSPIKFASQKQAGLWAVNTGNKKSSGQSFEVANHPSGNGFTVWEQTRRPATARAAAAPEGQSLVPTQRGTTVPPIRSGGEAAREGGSGDATPLAGSASPPITSEKTPPNNKRPAPASAANDSGSTTASDANDNNPHATSVSPAYNPRARLDLIRQRNKLPGGIERDALTTKIDAMERDEAARLRETQKPEGDSHVSESTAEPAERSNAETKVDEGSSRPSAEHSERQGQTDAPGRPVQEGEATGESAGGERGSGTEGHTGRGTRGKDGEVGEDEGVNHQFRFFGDTLYSNPIADPRVWKAASDMFVGAAKWSAGEAERFTDGLKNDVARFKELLKNTTSLVSWDRVKALGNMLKVISFGSKEGQLWSLYKRTNLDGFRELHSWIHSDPSGQRAVGRTVAESIQRDSSAWSNELRDIITELTKGRRPSEAKDVLDQLGKQIRAGTARSNTAMGKAAAGIKALLDTVHDRATAAGMSLGKVRENYLPRVLDTNEVLGNRVKFLATAKRAFLADDPTMTSGEAESDAERYLAHIEQQENGVRPGSTDFVRPGGATGGGNSTKGRVFSAKAERIFSDAGFYHENPADALNVYIRRMARDAALTEKLGPDLENWRRIKESVIKDPNGLELWSHAHDLMSKMLGFSPPISSVASGISNALRTLGSLTYLSGAAVLHTIQPALTAVRTGRPTDMIRAYANTLSALTGRARTDVKLAERLGLVERDLHDYLSETLSQQDAGAVSTKFFRTIGLEPLLKAVSVGAMKTGMHFIGHLADQFTEGGATQITTKRYLASLGVADADHAGFTKWVRGLKGTPGFDDMQSKYGQMMSLALQRIINQTIMRPTAAYRPLWAEHPFGKFAYSITSYMQSFSTLANERAWTMGKAALTERGLTPQDRIAHLMPAVLLATVVAPLTYQMYSVRNALLNKNPDRKEPAPSAGPIDDAWEVADVFSKSSLMGRWDSAYNLVRGMKYDRSAASAVTGPEISGLAQTAVQAVKTLGTDKDASVYAKRELADNVYRNFVFPAMMAAVVQSSAAASGSLAALGTIGTIFTLRNPSIRHMLFTDPATGTTSADVKGAGARSNRPNRAERKDRPDRK